MIFLKNDYGLGAHEKVFEALREINNVYKDSYGDDDICEKARDTIRELIGRSDADIHFMSGGTQTNKVALAAFLRPYEAVIAPSSGHICEHETGAIEATGHKCVSVITDNGKITPEQIEYEVKYHYFCQMVLPRVVYISDTTEPGTVYTKAELTAIRECCDRNGLYLYLDGARLAMALTAPGNDLTLKDLGALCDAFYIGGTKCGALFGEAIVILNDALKDNFKYVMRQNGALFAKGALLGAQFDALLSDGLYEELGKRANDAAIALASGMKAKGIEFAYPPASNQLFVIMAYEKLAELEKHVMLTPWEDRFDGTHIVRLVTSWATTEEDVTGFLELL